MVRHTDAQTDTFMPVNNDNNCFVNIIYMYYYYCRHANAMFVHYYIQLFNHKQNFWILFG